MIQVIQVCNSSQEESLIGKLKGTRFKQGKKKRCSKVCFPIIKNTHSKLRDFYVMKSEVLSEGQCNWEKYQNKIILFLLCRWRVSWVSLTFRFRSLNLGIEFTWFTHQSSLYSMFTQHCHQSLKIQKTGYGYACYRELDHFLDFTDHIVGASISSIMAA